MAQAAVPLAVASTGFKMFGDVAQGMTAASNATMRGQNAMISGILSAQQSEIAASYADAKAAQTDTQLRDMLGAALGNIEAVRAAANTAGNSPTGAAVTNRFTQMSDDARVERVANIRREASADRMNAQLQLFGGVQAMSQSQALAGQYRTGGFLKAGGDLLSGLSGFKFA